MSTAAVFLLSKNLPRYSAHLDKSLSAAVTVYECCEKSRLSFSHVPSTRLQFWTRNGRSLATPGAEGLRTAVRNQNPSVVYVVHPPDGQACADSDLAAVVTATDGLSVVLLFDDIHPPHYVAALRSRFHAVRVFQHIAARLIFAAEMMSVRPRTAVVPDSTVAWRGPLELNGEEDTLQLSSFELHCLTAQQSALAGRDLSLTNCSARLIAVADALPLFGSYLNAHAAFEMRVCSGADENTAKFVNAWVQSGLSLLIGLHGWRLWCFWRGKVVGGTEHMTCRVLLVPRISIESTMALAESCLLEGGVRGVPSFVSQLPMFEIDDLVGKAEEGKHLLSEVSYRGIADPEENKSIVFGEFLSRISDEQRGKSVESLREDGGTPKAKSNFQRALDGFVAGLSECPEEIRNFGGLDHRYSQSSDKHDRKSIVGQKPLHNRMKTRAVTEDKGNGDESASIREKSGHHAGNKVAMTLTNCKDNGGNIVEQLEYKDMDKERTIDVYPLTEKAAVHGKRSTDESKEFQVPAAATRGGGHINGASLYPPQEELSSTPRVSQEAEREEASLMVEEQQADSKPKAQQKGVKRPRTPLIVETQPLPNLSQKRNVDRGSLCKNLCNSFVSKPREQPTFAHNTVRSNRKQQEVIVVMDSSPEKSYTSRGTGNLMRGGELRGRVTACGVESEIKSVRTCNTESILTGRTLSQRSRTEVEDARTYRDKLIRQRYERLSRGKQSEANLLRSIRRTYPDRMEQQTKRARVNRESSRRGTSNNLAHIASARVKVTNLLESANPFFGYDFDCPQTKRSQCPINKQWRCICDTHRQISEKVAEGEYEFPRTAQHGVEYTQDGDDRDEHLAHYEVLVGFSGREFASMIKRIDSRAVSKLDRAVRNLRALGARQRLKGTAHDHVKFVERQKSRDLPTEKIAVCPRQAVGLEKDACTTTTGTGWKKIEDRRASAYVRLKETSNEKEKQTLVGKLGLTRVPKAVSQQLDDPVAKFDDKPLRFGCEADHGVSGEEGFMSRDSKVEGIAESGNRCVKEKRHRLVTEVLRALRNGELGEEDRCVLLESLTQTGPTNVGGALNQHAIIQR